MPLKRPIFKIGGSRAITLPKSWLELIERETGKPVKEIAMEVDGKLTIEPILPEQDKLNSKAVH